MAKGYSRNGTKKRSNRPKTNGEQRIYADVSRELD